MSARRRLASRHRTPRRGDSRMFKRIDNSTRPPPEFDSPIRGLEEGSKVATAGDSALPAYHGSKMASRETVPAHSLLEAQLLKPPFIIRSPLPIGFDSGPSSTSLSEKPGLESRTGPSSGTRTGRRRCRYSFPIGRDEVKLGAGQLRRTHTKEEGEQCQEFPGALQGGQRCKPRR